MSSTPVAAAAREAAADENFPSTLIRAVLGDITEVRKGVVYAHEHLIIDSPLIAERFPHIHLDSVDAAVAEVNESAAAGAALFVDCMPCSAGRDITRLAQISERTRTPVIAATGLHHDRYYGPLHWSNRVSADELADLFVADLEEGVDAFDYTGPIVRRTPWRAGIVKVATSGERLDARDERNLSAAAQASVRTGAPILTHCENGEGALAQIESLTVAGVPAGSIILSHVDKHRDLGYLKEIAATGAILECDQTLREHGAGVDSPGLQLIAALVEAGYDRQIVVGTDGARRSLWRSLNGSPGLSWLASTLPSRLEAVGLSPSQATRVLRDNAVEALGWRKATKPEETTEGSTP